MVYDVAVIGAGVVGSLIARELGRYNIKAVLLEKCGDVAMGTTKANSAIAHAGFDAKPGSLKAKMNLEGIKMMEYVCGELSVPYKDIGSLVVAFNEEEMGTLTELLERGRKNGVPGLEIVGQDRLREMEPNINLNAVGALYAPTAAIIGPYELAIAAVENAVTNGVEFIRNFEVKAVETQEDGTTVIRSADNVIQAKFVINSAGVFADDIAAMTGDGGYKIVSRKGEYFLLDQSVGGLVKHVVFQCPSKMGKGVLISPTVHGNILIGPNAVDIEDKEDCCTTAEGAVEILEKARRSIANLSTRDMITSFGGLRAHSVTEDFIIERSESNPNIIHLIGIESPGLTAAPAIAVYVRDMLLSFAGKFEENTAFDPIRPKPLRFHELSDEERRKAIERNKAYGRVICRCEGITEGEILDAIHAPAGARDVDAVKRRTRAGMGRCQGGFCGSKVVEILARELGVELNEVTKFGGDSKILFEKTK